jgi:hypothetical protein
MYRRLEAYLPTAFSSGLRSALSAGANVLDGLERPQDARELRRLVATEALDEAARLLQEAALP